MLATISVILLSGLIVGVYLLLSYREEKHHAEVGQYVHDIANEITSLTEEQQRIVGFLDAWVPQADSLPFWGDHIHWWAKSQLITIHPMTGQVTLPLPTKIVTKCRCGNVKKEEPQ